MAKLSSLVLMLLALVPAAFCAVAVKGYYRKDGTYVAPHMRSDPNGTKADNWSTQGNINPYTGKEGTKPLVAASSNSSTSTTDTATIAVSTPTPTAPPKPIGGMSDRELLELIYQKLTELENRVSALEASRPALTNPNAQTAKSTASPAIVSGGPGTPSIQQWRNIKAGMEMAEVLRVLGEPAKISNNGNGENWQYPGGGWVQFLNVGIVYKFGGYSSNN